MRINSSKKSEDLMAKLTAIFGFSSESIICRIAIAITLQKDQRFPLDIEPLDRKGKDFLSESNLFGLAPNRESYSIIYRALFDQHYSQNLSEDAFKVLFNHHLELGLDLIYSEISVNDYQVVDKHSYLMKAVKRGLDLVGKNTLWDSGSSEHKSIGYYEGLIEVVLGNNEKGHDIKLRINDLNEFDSCNMAIAGMVGSGKTELVKDILYQISKQSNCKLKFVFFDYKGEGDTGRLNKFLESTSCKMVDLKKAPLNLNPLSFINLIDKRAQEFNIRSFVDTICTIATQLGAKQKHIIQTLVQDLFNQIESEKSASGANKEHPTLGDLFECLKSYYDSNDFAPDSLFSIISDLSKNIFTTENVFGDSKFYEESLYINLPIELSDTLRQLCVFLTLRYLLSEFSSTNDTEPTPNRVKPLRYVIVIDEAHVYLKNKNASKALEDVLRILRSKGVVIIMLTQGVEDYKTKNFDFASQIKIPICLNINNKDYKIVESFLGTPRSKQRLIEAIGKLEGQKGVINLTEPQVIKIRQFWKTLQ